MCLAAPLPRSLLSQLSARACPPAPRTCKSRGKSAEATLRDRGSSGGLGGRNREGAPPLRLPESAAGHLQGRDLGAGGAGGSKLLVAPALLAQLRGEPLGLARRKAALADDKVVVLDFTAEWCLNCKTLEATVLQTTDVVAALDREDVVPMKIDLSLNIYRVGGGLQKHQVMVMYSV